MLAAERVLVLDDPAEFLALVWALDLLEAAFRRDGAALPAEVVAMRARAARYVALARVDGGKQPKTTSQVAAGAPIVTLSTMDVATRLGCSSSNVTQLVRRGRLAAWKASGAWRFDPLAVAELERRRSA